MRRICALFVTTCLCAAWILAPGCTLDRVQRTRPRLTLEAESSGGGECAVTACAIDFGLVYLGDQASVNLMIGNAGDGALNLTAISLDGDSEHFGLPADPAQTVEPGASLALSVTYAPQAEGEHSATLRLVSDDPDFGVVDVRLTGHSQLVPQPQIQVCVRPDAADPDQAPDNCIAPHALAFGPTALVPLGEPVPTPVVLRNLGQEQLIIHGLELTDGTPAEFTFDPDPTGVTLEPLAPDGTADELALTVWYAPEDGGDDDGGLRLTSNDPDNRELIIALSGQGIAPRICSDPLTLEFDRVAVDHTASRSFSLTNCGVELPLTIGRIDFHEQSSPEFSFAALPLTPFDLAPGEGIDIQVLYTPVDTGPDGARVVMLSNDPAAESGYILLQGEGTDEPVCDLELAPPRLNFGDVPVGDNASRTVALRNLGTAECHVDEIADPEGPGAATFVFSSLPLVPFSLGPGDQQTLTLRYEPDDAGPHRASFRVVSDDYFEAEKVVELYGNDPDVPECNLLVAPVLINFGAVAFWRTVFHELTIENRGAEPCVLAGLDFQPGSDPSFSLTEAPSLPAQLGPGEQVVVLVGFTPLEDRPYSGSLGVVSDDPDTPVQIVDLSGSGEELNLMVIPDWVDFGRVTVGCNSPERTVAVYNIGSTSVEIQDVYLNAIVTDPEFSMIALEHGGTGVMPPFTLPSSDSFNITTRYVPSDLTNNNGVLVIESSAAIGATLEVPLSGEGTDISTQSDVFQQLDHPMVDVLWVVDNSGSMGPYQQELATNFATFINWAITLDTDFHIGVISTEINEPETPAEFFDIYPGILVNYPGIDRIVTNDTPNLVQAFRRNVNLGTCCSDEQEAGLHAAMLALSEPLVSSPAANGGFMRDDAKLVIICVSDEPDQSPATVDFYVDFLKSIKGYRNDQLMDISAIVPSSSSRYRFAQESTGGLYRDLDSANWGSTLDELGLDAFAARTQFPLSRPAHPDTIIVTVDAHDGAGPQVIPHDDDESGDGWIFDQPTNSIVFGDDVVPGRGASIQIDYDTVCL